MSSVETRKISEMEIAEPTADDYIPFLDNDGTTTRRTQVGALVGYDAGPLRLSHPRVRFTRPADAQGRVPVGITRAGSDVFVVYSNAPQDGSTITSAPNDVLERYNASTFARVYTRELTNINLRRSGGMSYFPTTDRLYLQTRGNPFVWTITPPATATSQLSLIRQVNYVPSQHPVGITIHGDRIILYDSADNQIVDSPIGSSGGIGRSEADTNVLGRIDRLGTNFTGLASDDDYIYLAGDGVIHVLRRFTTDREYTAEDLVGTFEIPGIGTIGGLDVVGNTMYLVSSTNRSVLTANLGAPAARFSIGGTAEANALVEHDGTGPVYKTGQFPGITGVGEQDRILDMGGNKIVDVAAPTAGTDAANKAYVDGRPAGGGSADFGNIAEDVLPDATNTRDIGSAARSWDQVYARRTIHPSVLVQAQQTTVAELGVRDVYNIDFSGNDYQRIRFDNDPFIITGSRYMPGRVIFLQLENRRTSDADLSSDATGGFNRNGWHFSTRGVDGSSTQQFRIRAGHNAIYIITCNGTTAADATLGRLT